MFDLISLVACVLSIAGKICVNHKNRWNFVFFVGGYVMWLVYNFINTPNIPQVIMYVVYTILSMQGWVKWRREDKKKGEGNGKN